VKAGAYRCDVADFEAVKETVAQIKDAFGTVHILVNNAGITRDGLVARMKEEDFDAVIDTNLKGTFNMIRHCSGLFIRNKEGCIVNVSSVSGLMGNVGQCNYAASKAGLVGLTKSAAKELASKNIRCNAVAPGFIATDMTSAQGENPLVEMIPLKRMGKAEEVADAVAFLVQAEYVTGEVLRIDGGIAM
jgi:3-oxoacyl-[acyl-carrier protein] reductase